MTKNNLPQSYKNNETDSNNTNYNDRPPQSHSGNNETDSNKTDNNDSNTAAPAEVNSKKLKRGPMMDGNPEKLLLSIMKEDDWMQMNIYIMRNGYCLNDFQNQKGFIQFWPLKETPPKVQKGDKDFVQVFYVGGNRWVTVTNIWC